MDSAQTGSPQWAVIYQQGDERYLLVPYDEIDNPRSRMARIANTHDNRVTPPVIRGSVLAEGGWEEYTGDPELGDKLMRDAGLLW